MIACSKGILEYHLKQLNADIIGSGFLVNLKKGKFWVDYVLDWFEF